ncbi:MAG: hypothetical protein IJX38_04625 [Clostridia bacterium]|nr:hypothetical protein [Clostridia bacterium]
MGFGILFIGYFLLFNVTYPGFSNIIAALVMLSGLYKLASINKSFKHAFYVCAGFAGFSFVDLCFSVLNMFISIWNLGRFEIYFQMVRLPLICILTVLILSGIYDVAREVDLERVPKRATVMTYVVYTVYILALAAESSKLMSSIPPLAANIIAALTIIARFLVIIPNLVIIYTCYARIGMPGESNHKERKKSRFEFVNKMREHSDERNRINAEYKLEQMKKRAQKKRKKKK